MNLQDLDPSFVANLRNPIWRLDTLYWVRDDGGREINFRLRPEQLDLLRNLHSRNVVLKSRQLGFCLDPETRVLTADLRWVHLRDVAVGDELVAVDEKAATGRGKGRKMRTAVVEATATRQEKTFRIEFDDGRSVVCTAQHRWLSHKKGATDTVWLSIEPKQSAGLCVGSRVRWVTTSWGGRDSEDERLWEGRDLPGEKSGGGWATIVSITPLPEQAVIDLQTSCGTFIAEGFVSHNSTLIELLGLDQCLFNNNFACAAICDTLSNATKMFRNKVRYPYEKLPPALLQAIPLKIDNANGFVFRNGSSIEVGVSARSDTLQMLHVSEMGKIAANFPHKATEIVTGSFEAVTLDTGIIFVESTAEGEQNEFHRITMQAKQLQDAGKSLTRLEFKLHFYAWFLKPLNVLTDQETADTILSQKDHEYFEKVFKKTGAVLSANQKAWYVKKSIELGPKIKREHPSWAEEAFEAPIDGAILEHEMTLLDKMGRIGSFPWVPQLPVHTFWDIKGTTAIWCMQRVNGRNRFIHYVEDVNMGFEYFVNRLNALGYTWGMHFLPHDGRTRIQGLHVETPQSILERLGFRRPEIVPRVATKALGIALLKPFLLASEFDEQGCPDGLKALRNFRRQWSEIKGGYVDEPMDNWAAHGTDAIRQAAQAGEIPSHENTSWSPMGWSGPYNAGRVPAVEVMDAEVGF